MSITEHGGDRTAAPMMVGEGLQLKYDDRVIVDGLDIAIPRGELTMIIGPNGCGKSTLLKALARTLGRLPQGPVAPDGITVADLVSRGRYPYHQLLRQWSHDDEVIVNQAMADTGVLEFARRGVDELSGGERQRVWLAMVLAQQTGTLLLDEPTTYLDLAHQIDVLELCSTVRRTRNMTVVVVIHELNLAIRYADHLIVVRGGDVLAVGAPWDIVTEELIEQTFSLPCRVIEDPETRKPLVIPRVRSTFLTPQA